MPVGELVKGIYSIHISQIQAQKICKQTYEQTEHRWGSPPSDSVVNKIFLPAQPYTILVVIGAAAEVVVSSEAPKRRMKESHKSGRKKGRWQIRGMGNLQTGPWIRNKVLGSLPLDVDQSGRDSLSLYLICVLWTWAIFRVMSTFPLLSTKQH